MAASEHIVGRGIGNKLILLSVILVAVIWMLPIAWLCVGYFPVLAPVDISVAVCRAALAAGLLPPWANAVEATATISTALSKTCFIPDVLSTTTPCCVKFYDFSVGIKNFLDARQPMVPPI